MKTSLLLPALTVITAASQAAMLGDFCPGTVAEMRASSNYIIADTIGQLVVGESFAQERCRAIDPRQPRGMPSAALHV